MEKEGVRKGCRERNGERKRGEGRERDRDRQKE